MKKIFIIFTLVSITRFVYAQNPRHPLHHTYKCDLAEKNKIWWQQINLEKDKNQQINLIKTKILADTIYPNIKKENSDNFYSTDREANICEPKILFVLNHKKSIILNTLEVPELKNWLNEISPSQVEVHLLTPTTGGTAIFGVKGSSGVVLLNAITPSLKEKIETHLWTKMD